MLDFDPDPTDHAPDSQRFIREWAEDLAIELCSVRGAKNVKIFCERLQMMKRQSDGSEHNMGGRCFKSVADVIEAKILQTFNSLGSR